MQSLHLTHKPLNLSIMSTDTLKNELKRAMIGAHVKLSDDMLSKCEF